MAAVTVTAASQKWENYGSVNAYIADISSVDDGDTFAAATIAGFGIVHQVVFTPTTAVLVVPSFSGTTITFKVAAGSVAGRLLIIGK